DAALHCRDRLGVPPPQPPAGARGRAVRPRGVRGGGGGEILHTRDGRGGGGSTARRAPERVSPRRRRGPGPPSVEVKSAAPNRLVVLVGHIFISRRRDVCEYAVAATGATRRAGRK